MALATVVVAIMLVEGARVFRARAMAATAADAAALAAAPVTFRPVGVVSSPAAEAERFARLNGAELLQCLCPIDRSDLPRNVEVVVSYEVRLLLAGRRLITATSRAQFVPAGRVPS